MIISNISSNVSWQAPTHSPILFTQTIRSLEHSTILYESPDLTPLLRIAWNKQVDSFSFMIDCLFV